MIRKAIWSLESQDELRGIDRVVARRVVDSVTRYVGTGYGDIKRLKGRAAQYRLRVGDYRVIFALDAAREEMVILHVRHRREAYRD